MTLKIKIPKGWEVVFQTKWLEIPAIDGERMSIYIRRIKKQSKRKAKK